MFENVVSGFTEKVIGKELSHHEDGVMTKQWEAR